MARYLSTSVSDRWELIPSQDGEDLSVEALLENSERRKLQSYRLPSGTEADTDSVPTARWTAHELEALLAIAQATVEPADDPKDPARLSTVPPRPNREGPRAVRRSEVVMSDVRARLRGTTRDS